MKYSIKKILWATDFSASAANALTYAEFFARKFDAKITAVHVLPEIEPALIEARPALLEDLYEQVGLKLGQARKKLEALASHKDLRFGKVLIEPGSPAKKIVEIAEKDKADLIVLGKTGLSGLERIVLGSVANGVLRHSPAPVLVVGKKRTRPRIGKILVPTDFSPHEEVERDIAWTLASAFKADLTLLNVLVLHDYRVQAEYSESLLREVLNRLKARKAREKKDFAVSEDVVAAVNAAAGIVNYADLNRFDLIAISSMAHSKLARLFLGSNTERVISISDVPVFAIPPACSEE
jgi:nucleotide-binding universal stress UspA family protein